MDPLLLTTMRTLEGRRTQMNTKRVCQPTRWPQQQAYRHPPNSVNTLILGPGGYSFGDYWRMGLPLEIIVVTVSIPAILVFWPL